MEYLLAKQNFGWQVTSAKLPIRRSQQVDVNYYFIYTTAVELCNAYTLQAERMLQSRFLRHCGVNSIYTVFVLLFFSFRFNAFAFLAPKWS